MIWPILLVVSVLVLVLHLRTKNAVWGTATLGFFIGLIVAFVMPGFDWWIIGKAVVIATFIGTAIEWLPRLMAKKQSDS